MRTPPTPPTPRPNDMLALLAEVERAMPQLLDDDARWQTLDIDYEPPRVERAWTTFGATSRVSIHRIHPCERALFHPHPWPSAVWIVSGSYEMAVGFGAGDVEPPEAARCVLAAGSRYEMIHEDGWHSVRPLGAPSLSVMVTGQPWQRPSPGKDHDHAPLSSADRRRLLDDVRVAIVGGTAAHAGPSPATTVIVRGTPAPAPPTTVIVRGTPAPSPPTTVIGAIAIRSRS